LLLLLLVPILLLLRRRAYRPREAVASSLLLWRRIAATSPVPPDHPRPPPSAWWEAAGVTLLALAAADPRFSGGGERPVTVVLDSSPSMGALRAPGETRLEFARRVLAESGRQVEILEAPEPFAIARARAGVEGGDVVVVTDRVPPSQDALPFAVVSVGSEVSNVGITSARGIVDERGVVHLHLLVEATEPPGSWPGTIHWENGSEMSATVAPGRPLSVARTVDAASSAGPWTLRIRYADDALAADDVVTMRRVGGASVEAQPGAAAFADLLRAVRATGRATVVDASVSDDLDLVMRFQRDGAGEEFGGPETLTLRRVPRAMGQDAGAIVRAVDLLATDDALVADVHPDPILVAGRRVATGALAPGAPLLVDLLGPLVAVERPSPREWIVHLALEPDADWTSRDSAFVVLVENLIDAVAGGPPRVEAHGLLDPRETLCSSAPVGTVGEALAAARTTAATGAAVGPWLLLGAAAALALAAVRRP
jgi:hypothetical protein